MALVLFKDAIISTKVFLSVFMPIHVIAVSFFTYSMKKLIKKAKFNSPGNWSTLIFYMCFIFSVGGFVSFSVIYLLFAKRRWQRGTAYEAYEKYIYSDFKSEKKFSDLDNLAEASQGELEISPLVDVLGEDDVQMRRGAINIMKHLPKEDAVRLLKHSLNDKNVEIRFFAAAELSRIETEMNDNIVMAEEEIRRHPDSADSHLSLANSYSEYFESGILDEVTANYYQELAIKEYYNVLELGGEDVGILNYIAKLEVLNGELDKAMEKFKKVCELDPENIFANVGIIQISYQTGDLKRAKKLSKK